MSYQPTEVMISKATIEATNKALSDWGCSKKERLSLFGVSEKQHELISTCSEVIACNIGLRTRVSYILSISECLSAIFNDKENRDGFLKLKNEADLFNGSTPMDYIIANGHAEALVQVYRYLKDMWLTD